MSLWVAPPTLELRLWYGDALVADLHQVFPHQGTWFAEYELKVAAGGGMLTERLLEYITFSEDFNRRIALGQDHDFAEFDRFGDIYGAESWRVPRPDGGVMPMEGPIMFSDGQVSWQHPETPPSTEAAANRLWEFIAAYVVEAERSL